jgi:hypothetical protein
MPAMRFGGTLTMPAPVSPRMLRGQREFQAIQRAWSLEWGFGYPQLEEVEVRAPTAPPPTGRPGRIGTFFSGGVDSWSTVLEHPEITDLIFVRGFDLMPDDDRHVSLVDQVEDRLRAAAAELELPLHVVETNLRELSDPLLRWDAYFGAGLVAATLFMAPLFERFLLATDSDYEVQQALGVSRLATQLWSTEHLEIVEDGGRYSRLERLRRIASHPIVRRTLRVCWENPGGSYNCGRCRKCLMTMISLEALGMRQGIETFPERLDLFAVADIEITHPVNLTLWEDVLDAVRAAGRADLEPAVEVVVMGGKERLGLGPEYRRRRGAGPAPLRDGGMGTPGSNRSQTAGDSEKLLAAVLASRSWRLTAPLRTMGSRLRRMRRQR